MDIDLGYFLPILALMGLIYLCIVIYIARLRHVTSEGKTLLTALSAILMGGATWLCYVGVLEVAAVVTGP